MMAVRFSCVVAALLCLATVLRADEPATPLVDRLMFGDAASEKAHALDAGKTQIIPGALGESARELEAGGDVAWESTPLHFTMKVDPAAQNYFTIKLWGGDKGEAHGRLILFANGLQVGYRNQGDYDVLNQADEDAEAPGRFIYQTIPLPPSLTHGKTSLDLRIVALGAIWVYGPTFDQVQKPYVGPSRGLYAAYTHTDGYFAPPADEKQGASPTPTSRTAPGEEVIAQSRQIVIDRLGKLLAAPPSPPAETKPLNALLLLLGKAYTTTWTPASRNPADLDRLIAAGDKVAASITGDPKSPILNDWPGAGPLGQAIIETWPDIDTKLDAAQHETWAKALKMSVDYWRTHRRSYTNQSMIVDYNIYTANRALGLLDPKSALPESKTIHFLYQAIGLEPWLGSDLAPGAQGEPVPDLPNQNVTAPLGHHYELVTKKGLSRELGYVAGYGETILRFVHDMAVLTGDEKIRQQLIQLEHARFYFRYPSLDADGNRCMKLASEIDNRGTHFPMTGSAYNAAANRENWWMDVPALCPDDPAIVGAAQQGLADGQYFAYIAGRLKDADTLGMMLNVDDYAKAKALPPSPWRLPMTDGQPDFAFADEEDAVVALKHGDDRLYINFYYRAERAVNGIARILYMTPQVTRLATVQSNFELTPSGQTYTRPDWIDSIRSRGLPPPNQDLHQAWAGQQMPIAQRPADAPSPKYGDWGPYLGKANFYTLKYGPYLIALNTTADQTYPLPTPAGLKAAKDLVSGKTLDLGNGLKVAPQTTVILDLSETR